MEMAADLISMEWSKVLLRLIAFIIFGFGVVSAYLLTNYTKLNMRKLALWVDVAGLTLASLIPLDPVLVGLYPIFSALHFSGVHTLRQVDLTAPLFLQRIIIKAGASRMDAVHTDKG